MDCKESLKKSDNIRKTIAYFVEQSYTESNITEGIEEGLETYLHYFDPKRVKIMNINLLYNTYDTPCDMKTQYGTLYRELMFNQLRHVF